MRNLKLLRITHFLTLLVVITICNSCFENKTDFKSEFIKNLTNDSIGYWDKWPDEYKYGVKDGPIYTYGFNQRGILEYYSMRHDLILSEETDKRAQKFVDSIGNTVYVTTEAIGKRMYIELDSIPRPRSFKTNKWVVRNDSTLNFMDVYSYKIIRYSKDSIIMKLTSLYGHPYEDTIKRFEILYRVKESDLRLDIESKKLKDSLDRSRR